MMNRMGAKKRILFMVNSLAGGGAEKALIELLRNFDYERYDVELCVVFNIGVYLNDVPRQVKMFHLYNSEGHGAHHHALRLYRKHGLDFLFRWRVRSRVKGNYDAIVSFLEGDSLLLHSMVTDRAKRNITWLHCNLASFHWTRKLFPDDEFEKRAYSKMDAVVGCSRCALDSLYGLYHLPLPGCVIPNIIDAGKIRELAEPEPQVELEPAPELESPAESGSVVTCDRLFTISSVGSLSDVKCYDRLIRAASKLREDGYDLCFRVAGDGKLRNELEALRDSFNLGDSFQFLGFVKPPYHVIKNSDLFVSTSRSEAAPLVFCEAMAVGVPVVATRNEGSAEILGNSDFGLLVQQDDESIYQGIKRMIDDAALRERYIAQGERRLKMFSKETTLAKLTSLFES